MVAPHRIWKLDARPTTWILGPRLTSGLIAPEVVEKQPSEKLRLAMDFSAWATPPETLSELEVSADDELVVSGETIDGKMIRFFVEGGFSPRRYKIGCRVDSSSGETIIGSGILKVSGR